MNSTLKVGILTVSDRCSRREAEDTSGDNLVSILPGLLSRDVDVIKGIVPDDVQAIQAVLLEWCDVDKKDLVLTTGGTGLSPRDVTPEATQTIIEKSIPGICHMMTAMSLKVTPLACLSRAIAGIRKSTLIINLPGSKKGSAECLNFIVQGNVLNHAMDLISNKEKEVSKTHKILQSEKTKNVQGTRKSKVDPSSVANRDRSSPYPMISVEEAQKIVMTECVKLEFAVERVKLNKARGRILAQNVFAKTPLPPFRASIKDGYAVIAADGDGDRPVIGDSNAGNDPDVELKSGHCMRINTGAPVPNNADAVVQVEDTELVKASENGQEELVIRILKKPTAGQDIRNIGFDIQEGSLVLKKHTNLGPAELGLLATVGVIQVDVFTKPTVGLLSTGNELQDPSVEFLRPGAIRDSNKTTLTAILDEAGFPYVDCGICLDDPDHVLMALEKALACSDVVVTTGGVSMGDKDFLKQVLQKDLKAQIHFARVHMKPGKPTTFATLTYQGKQKVVLGLPGNPVSAFVTSQLYLLPMCRMMSGSGNPMPALVRARIPNDLRLDPRPEYHRAILEWERGSAVAKANLTGNQISSRLLSCTNANALLLLPRKTENLATLEAGTEVDAMVIGALFSNTSS